MRIAIKAAIRIILIYVFIRSLIILINQITATVNYARVYPDDFGLLLSITFLVGGTILGFLILAFIWIKTDWIVEKIAGEIPENQFTITTSNIDLFKVAMRILGIILLAYSIPSLIGLLGYHFNLPAEYFEHSQETRANEIKNLLTVGVQIIIGIGLTLGTKGLERVWDKAHLISSDEAKEE